MNLILKAKIVENYGTQADFAQVIGIDETIVSRVVRGRHALDEGNKSTWARALGCRLEDIFPSNNEHLQQTTC